MAAEIHQRQVEDEKENQPADSKEKIPQMGGNKKVKKEKEPPKKKKADKKAKGICGVIPQTWMVQSLPNRKQTFHQVP